MHSHGFQVNGMTIDYSAAAAAGPALRNPTDKLHVQLMRSVADLDALKAHWKHLEDICRPAIFSAYEWTKAWWAAYGHGGELFVLLAWDDGGKLKGMAPVHLRIGRGLRLLEFIGDNQDSGRLEFLADPSCRTEVVQAFLGFLHRSSSWDVICLRGIDDDVVTEFCRGQHVSRDWRFRQTKSSHLAVSLAPTWPEFLAGLSRKRRASIDRTWRHLERDFSVSVRPCSEAKQIPGFLDNLFALHSARWQRSGSSGAFADERRRRFYAMIAEEFLGRGWLDCWQLELSGRVVAAEFGCRRFGVRYAMQSGFDPEFAAYGVGFALESHVLRHAIESGDRLYDFIAGTETYKARWGATNREYHHLCLARARSVGSVALRVAEWRERFRNLGRCVIEQ